MKKLLKKIPPGFIAGCVKLVLKIWSLTFRIKIIDPHNYLSPENFQNNNYVFLFWHNRSFFIPYLVPAGVREKSAGLVSLSRDGEIQGKYMNSFGIHIIRGSSSRGGGKALLELEKVLNEGMNVVLTPDGPRGPKYQLKNGAVKLASRTGVPIVPIALNSRPHKELSNWDNTQLPMPFATIELVLGEAIEIPEKLDMISNDHEMERVRAAMMALTKWDHKPLQ